MEEISFFVAFFAGLATFFAPCTFVALPTFLTYIAGQSLSPDQVTDKKFNSKVLISTLIYISGFLFVFTILGLSTSYIGFHLNKQSDLFERIGGFIIILFGLFIVFGDKIKPLRFLYKEQKINFEVKSVKNTLLFPFVIGLTNAFAWTPCIGPILGGILLLSASTAQEKMFQGAGLLFVYGLGLSIPFILIAIFFGFSQKIVKKINGKILNNIYKITGLLMIFMGIAILFGFSDQLFAYLYRFFILLGYKPL
jgi:cytochrome c-type biogenesis protein